MKRRIMCFLFVFVMCLTTFNTYTVHATDGNDVTVLKTNGFQQRLQSGKYKIEENVTFKNGLVIPSGETVYIEIPAGLTLTCNGKDAGYEWEYETIYVELAPNAYYEESTAGITVEEDAKLILSGGGNVVAKGGSGLVAEDGFTGCGYHYLVLFEDKEGKGRSSPIFKYAHGGAGGSGGFAPSPAIGGDGGAGGVRTQFCSAPADKINYTETRVVESPNNGIKGNDGEDGGTMGTVYILDSVNVTATAGTNYPDVGKAATVSHYVDYGTRGNSSSLWHIYTTISGPGGGGGGSNASPIIGGGGAGGGSGGSGASGSISASISNTRDIIDNMHKPASSGSGVNGGDGGVPDAASLNKKPITLLGGEGGKGGTNGKGGTLYISATASVNGKNGTTLTQSDLGETTNNNAGQAANVKKLTHVTVTVKTDGVEDSDHSVSIRGVYDDFEFAKTGNDGEFQGYVPTNESNLKIFVDGVDSGFVVDTSVDTTSQVINYYTCNVNVKKDGTLDAGHSVTLTRNNSLIGTMEETATPGVFSGVFLVKNDEELNKYNVYVDGQDSKSILYSNKENLVERTVECNYYTGKVTVKQDGGTWSSSSKLNVSLRGNNKTINMSPTANAGEFTTVLFAVDTTTYSVYVNNIPSEQTLSVSSLNTTVNYYTGVLKLSLDGAPYENSTVLFTNGNYSFVSNSGTNNGTYCEYKVALPESIKNADTQEFSVEVAGVVDSSTHSVSSSSKTTTADFFSVKYYTSSIDSDTGKIVENNTLYKEYAVLSGMTINPSPSSYLKGMTFSCWNDSLYDEFEDEDAQTSFDFTTPITTATKLYAHFRKPNVQLNGIVRCDESRTIASDGLYYYLPNLYITGYDQNDVIKHIKAEFTNVESIKFPTDYPSGVNVTFSALSGTTPAVSGEYTTADTITIEFSQNITVAQAQEYLRRVLVKPTLDVEHKLSFTVSDSVLSLYKKEDYTYTTIDGIDYTKISSSTPAGSELSTGYYYVTENTTLDGSVGGTKDASSDGTNGLKIAENANVTIYIPEGVTLTAIGANGNGQTGGKAGILLPETSTLTAIGKGTLISNGGNGGNAQNGSYAPITLDYCVHSRWQNGGQNLQTAGGSGGIGGFGGGGAGAGIGTDGGQGGAAVGGGGGPTIYPTIADKKKGTYYSGAGGNGNDGKKADTCGNFYTYGITLNVDGGTAGNAGTAATNYLSYQIVGDSTLPSNGHWVWGQMHYTYANYAGIYDYGVYINGTLGASGGGGGAGYDGRDIGNGGSGGGSGGGGAGGGIIISTSYGQYIKANGGKGGSGSINGSNAGTNITGGSATNPNAGGTGGNSDNTGKEITSADSTLVSAPQYTITFDGTEFGGVETTKKYDYFVGGQVSLPDALSVKGLVFKGWTVTKYGSNLNGDVTDCTNGDTKVYSASAINLSSNTSGDIILKPTFEEIAAKYAVGKLTATLSAAPTSTYETYTVNTKLNGEACDVESLVLKNGAEEYNLSSNDNGEYSLIAEEGKEFDIWCNGVDTGKKITTGTYSQTVELISIDIDVQLNDVSTESLGVVTLVDSDSNQIELNPVYSKDGKIKGYHTIKLASVATSYNIYLDGKDTNKDIELSSSAASMTLKYYTIQIETRIDDSLSDVGTVTLRNNDGIESVHSTTTPGSYNITKAEDSVTYTIYVGSDNTGKTVSFTHDGYKPSDKSAYVINYRTIVINTKNNNVAQNLGTVDLKKDSTSITVPNTDTGVYEEVLLEDVNTEYQVYVGGVKTNKVVKSTKTDRTCTIYSNTLSLKTIIDGSPTSVGSVVLKANNKADINMTYQTDEYKTTTLLSGKYDVYVNDKDTGVDFDIANTLTTTLHYYTLHYDVDGGVANVPGDTIYLDGTKTTLTTAIPTKDTFQFIGWSDNSSNMITSQTQEITINSGRHTLTAKYISISDFNTRYKDYGSDWTYADLKDALDVAANNTSKNYEIELLKNASLDVENIISSKVTLSVSSDLVLSGNITNQGTIKLSGSLNGTVDNDGTIEGCGVANDDNEITNPAFITTLNNKDNGTVSGCKITLVKNNLGTLNNCHIVSGTSIEGTLTGTIYTQKGVTFSESVIPQNSSEEKATISIEGGGTLHSLEELNNSDIFAGLMVKNEIRYQSLANIYLRNKISVSSPNVYAKLFTYSKDNTTTIASNIEGMGEITSIYYRSKKGNEWSDWTTTVPKDVGTHQIKIDVADGLYFVGMKDVIDDPIWSYSINPHICTFSKTWSMDDTYHWHAATCSHTSEVSNYEKHTFGGWIFNNKTKYRICSICGYKQTVGVFVNNDNTDIDDKQIEQPINNNPPVEDSPVINKETIETSIPYYYIIVAITLICLIMIWLLRRKNLKLSALILAVDVVTAVILTLFGMTLYDAIALSCNLLLCTSSFVIQLRPKVSNNITKTA